MIRFLSSAHSMYGTEDECVHTGVPGPAIWVSDPQFGSFYFVYSQCTHVPSISFDHLDVGFLHSQTPICELKILVGIKRTHFISFTHCTCSSNPSLSTALSLRRHRSSLHNTKTSNSFPSPTSQHPSLHHHIHLHRPWPAHPPSILSLPTTFSDVRQHPHTHPASAIRIDIHTDPFVPAKGNYLLLKPSTPHNPLDDPEQRTWTMPFWGFPSATTSLHVFEDLLDLSLRH